MSEVESPEISILRFPNGSVVASEGNGRFRLIIQGPDAAALQSRATEDLVHAELEQSFGNYAIVDQSTPYPVNSDGSDWDPIDPTTRRMRARPEGMLYRRDWVIRKL